jgi:hypothetical protein
MGDWWSRRPGSWWPFFLPWVGVETWDAETAFEVLDAARPVRVLHAEWFRRGVTIAAWEVR